MSTLMIVVLIVVVLAIAAAVWLYMQKRRTQTLRSRFGPEYDRMVEDHGDRNRAEKVLLERQKRVDSFDIKPLPPPDRDRFAQRWQDAPHMRVGSEALPAVPPLWDPLVVRNLRRAPIPQPGRCAGQAAQRAGIGRGGAPRPRRSRVGRGAMTPTRPDFSEKTT